MTTILDTNVTSELNRERPNPAVLGWWYRQVTEEMFTTAITEAEMRYGLAIMPVGRRRNRQASRTNYMLRVFFENRSSPLIVPPPAPTPIYAPTDAQSGGLSSISTLKLRRLRYHRPWQ